MRLTLELLPQRLAVARLGASDDLPAWVNGDLTSVSRTPNELSIICDNGAVPEDVPAERDWCCLRVRGTIPFDAVGILASIAVPLRDAGVPVFVLSTYETDYLLVTSGDIVRAQAVLIGAGHSVEPIDG